MSDLYVIKTSNHAPEQGLGGAEYYVARGVENVGLVRSTWDRTYGVHWQASLLVDDGDGFHEEQPLRDRNGEGPKTVYATRKAAITAIERRLSAPAAEAVPATPAAEQQATAAVQAEAIRGAQESLLPRRFATQHWSPRSVEDSAYGWDRLVDGIMGHTGRETSQSTLDGALGMLTDGDVALLHTIFLNVPTVGTEHIFRALARENRRRHG